MNWLTETRILASPNFNDRPPGQNVELLVIHAISLPPEQFGDNYVEMFFTNQLPVDRHPYFAGIAHLKVSSHLYIRRDGQCIQFVDLDKRAWHAGQSAWQGRTNCNDFSIGIELEGSDTQAFTDQQYLSLIKVTRSIQSIYPRITADQICGHSDIAPGRKTDPGPHFDWNRYLSSL